jgi:hypothetical protein
MLRCVLSKMFVEIICANCVPAVFGCVKGFGLADVDLSRVSFFLVKYARENCEFVKPFVLKA